LKQEQIKIIILD